MGLQNKHQSRRHNVYHGNLKYTMFLDSQSLFMSHNDRKRRLLNGFPFCRQRKVIAQWISLLHHEFPFDMMHCQKEVITFKMDFPLASCTFWKRRLLNRFPSDIMQCQKDVQPLTIASTNWPMMWRSWPLTLMTWWPWWPWTPDLDLRLWPYDQRSRSKVMILRSKVALLKLKNGSRAATLRPWL